MKAKTKVDVRTSAGLVQAPCYCQWKQDIGGMEFEFALHVAAGHPKGFVAPLAISELGTGFDTRATVRHPKSGAPLTSANVQGLTSADVRSVANAALHSLIHKRIGAGRFLQAMLGAQMQINKVQAAPEKSAESLAQFSVSGTGTGTGTGTETFRNTEALDKLRGLGTPGTATITCTATPEQVAILDQMFGSPCETCDGSKVVSTTDKDHEGNNIEITCPACIPKAIELPETPVSQMGGVGYRFDVAMTPGDPAADQYIPSPEEAAAALEDASTMNDNMAKHGTIDVPKPVGEELEMKIKYLKCKLEGRRDRAAQHGTMTGDTTEQDYEALAGDITDLEDQIADLEGESCSN